MTTIFLHIRKAGGTTMRHAMRWGTAFTQCHTTSNVQATDYRSMSAEKRERIGLLQGHLLYGIHESCPGPHTYVTMLRDPVRRVFSAYYYVTKTHPGTYKEDMGLEGFGTSPRYCNHIAGYLAGITVRQQHKITDRELLDRAMKNLKSGIAVAGLTEKFDESLILMRRKLGWPLYPFYLRAKSNTSRPSFADVPQSTRSAIRDANHVDVKLYEYAKQRIEHQLNEFPGIRQEVDRFQQLNQYYQNYGGPLINVARIFRNLANGRAPFHEYRIHDLTN